MAPKNPRPVERLQKRARANVGIKLSKGETAYIASLISRQNVTIQTLTGITKEYERLLGENGEVITCGDCGAEYLCACHPRFDCDEV